MSEGPFTKVSAIGSVAGLALRTFDLIYLILTTPQWADLICQPFGQRSTPDHFQPCRRGSFASPNPLQVVLKALGKEKEESLAIQPSKVPRSFLSTVSPEAANRAIP